MGEAAPSRRRGLELFGVSVTRLSRNEIIVEEVEEILECGPLLRICVPTLGHALINRVRTFDSLWLRHAAALLDVLNHLPVWHPCKRRKRFLASQSRQWVFLWEIASNDKSTREKKILTWIRYLAVCYQLIQQNAVRPHIGFD